MSKEKICENVVQSLVEHGYDNAEDIEALMMDIRSVMNQGTGLMWSQIHKIIEETL